MFISYETILCIFFIILAAVTKGTLARPSAARWLEEEIKHEGQRVFFPHRDTSAKKGVLCR